MIMTVYLWHITVMIVVGGLLYLSGGFGLGIEPGTQQWWLTRPVWIGILIVVLVPVALLLSVFERGGKSGATPPSVVRQIVGAMMLCLGIAVLALFGYGGGPQHLDIAAFVVFIAGAMLSGLVSWKR